MDWRLAFSETHQQIIPPDFTKNLKSVDALEGSPFAFECHIMGIPSPTISWYKDEINIDNSPEYVITKINGTCCLKIKKVTREHSARYTCRANNPGGEAASSARLTVIRKFPWCIWHGNEICICKPLWVFKKYTLFDNFTCYLFSYTLLFIKEIPFFCIAVNS